MKNKKLDSKKTIYELAQEHEDFVEIMIELGFSEISKNSILQSLGKIMTLERGAKMKKISIEKIVETFSDKGYEVIGLSEIKEESNNRTALIKSYLKRLGEGEALESVQKDFVREFGEVEASEIMKAEQELMKEGTPLEEVQKLCDVHSALFHGSIKEEKITESQKEVINSHDVIHQSASQNKENALSLEGIKGHPLYTLHKENEQLERLIITIQKAIEKRGDVSSLLKKLREISIHYAKKGDLLYPNLSVKYNVTGPSEVMWTVDDEIRDELAELEKEMSRDDWWFTRLNHVVQRAQEMIYKEQNILFPICAAHFKEQEWMGIYHDSKDYAECLDTTKEIWLEAENRIVEKESLMDEKEIVMPGGHMNVEQLTALLNTIPLEISFIDADNINRFFNEGPKVFKRPSMAIDREVFSCHPPKIEPMVRSIIEDFRNNRRDSVPVWMDKNGCTFLVTYMAVRDKDNKYIGTVELVQDMGFVKKHFGIE